MAIHYRDSEKINEPVGVFTSFEELNSILRKVKKCREFSITNIIYNQNKFDLDKLYIDYPTLKNEISSNGKEKRLTSGCMKYECFRSEKKQECYKILGLDNGRRNYKYIEKKYIDSKDTNLNGYKVIVPANNGSGAIGEVASTPLIGTPLIGTPLMGYTQTFISFGNCEELEEAENIFKYIKGKFARAMLGILKVTQNGKKPVWECVPMQNFKENSDIDWKKSISEIDQQLYKKYNLSQNEIEFIETHVKEME